MVLTRLSSRKESFNIENIKKLELKVLNEKPEMKQFFILDLSSY